MKHANISIFVPHLGCPNDCSFCNQKHITGTAVAPSAQDVKDAVNIAVNSPNYDAENTEIAFFGGSFTSIEREYMLSLLEAAAFYVQNGTVKGIRVSTRPDSINDDILVLLKKYGVTAIELGAQSMVDSVLLANDRGHKADDVVRASKLIKSYGFELGLQMMTGLFGDDDNGAVYTARKLVELKPKTVRIYPTIVLENTKLAKLYKSGEYEPQSLDSAVCLCAKLGDMFRSNGIAVIRTGLHTVETASYVDGPWHPAFSELCETERLYNKIISYCEKGKRYEIFVNPTDISKALGQKRNNLARLLKEGYNISFIQDSTIIKNTINIKEVK